MQKQRIIIVAASSDIGAHLTEHFLRSGAEVVGTYRSKTSRVGELEKLGARMFPLEITCGEQVKAFARTLRASGFTWNILISAPGLLEPIGPFFATDFDAWEQSVLTNSTAQLRVLHAMHGLRDPAAPNRVIFFAGGGTNGPFDNYSAYCIGKMSLIKMTELLDSECPHLQVSIIGTGWVNTKIHQQTLNAGEAAGVNFDRTRQFLASGERVGASVEDVAACIDWCLAAPRSAVGGRNFALANDPWQEPGLIEALQADKNRYKLRRHA